MIARLLIFLFAALAVVALGSLFPAWAAGWVVAAGKPMTLCEQQAPPEVRLGPKGVEHFILPPKCREVRTGKAPTFHLDAGRLVSSQQTVAEGVPCLRTITLDHHTYGQTAAGGSLWALCTPR